MKLLLSLASLLLLFPSFGAGQEELTPVLDSGDGILLHFWLSAEAIEDKIPEGFSPAAFALDPLATKAPGGKVDLLILIRKANWQLPINGSKVEENNLLDAFLVLPVKKDQSIPKADSLDLLILQHFSENKLLEIALQAALKSKPLQGSLSLVANPAGGLRLKAKAKLDKLSTWNLAANSTENTRFSFPYTSVTFHLPTENGFTSFTAYTEKNSWFRARSIISNFRDNNPLNSLGEWLWADSNTYLIVFEENRFSRK